MDYDDEQTEYERDMAEMDQEEYFNRCHEVHCLACKIQAWAVEAELRQSGWHLSKAGEFCPDHADYPAHEQLVERYRRPTLRQSQSDALLEYYDEQITTVEDERRRYCETYRLEDGEATYEMDGLIARLKAERDMAEMIETIDDAEQNRRTDNNGSSERECVVRDSSALVLPDPYHDQQAINEREAFQTANPESLSFVTPRKGANNEK